MIGWAVDDKYWSSLPAIYLMRLVIIAPLSRPQWRSERGRIVPVGSQERAAKTGVITTKIDCDNGKNRGYGAAGVSRLLKVAKLQPAPGAANPRYAATRPHVYTACLAAVSEPAGSSEVRS